MLYTLFLINDLHLDPFLLGVVISAGGVGALLGSFVASRVIRTLGLGRALIWTAVGGSAIGILTPLAQGPLLLATAMVLIPQLVGDGLETIEEVAELSLIQGQTPDRILGRVNATLGVLTHGFAYPIGAIAAAVVAESLGVRAGIAIGWAGMALSIVPLVLSPVAGDPSRNGRAGAPRAETYREPIGLGRHRTIRARPSGRAVTGGRLWTSESSSSGPDEAIMTPSASSSASGSRAWTQRPG